MKKIYGLIGFPLGHSFSASYFSEKFSTEKIDAEYRNFPMGQVDDVRDFVEANPGLQGFNVTIPHKQAIIPFLDELSAAAEDIGAVNVVKISRESGRLRLSGFNTDYIGFEESLKPMLPAFCNSALVLGTGGASRAVVYALKRLGISPQLVSRKSSCGILRYEDLNADIMRSNRLIVNCTPLGMFPDIDSVPPVLWSEVGSGHLLYDLVYNPAQTKFMRMGIERGARVKNGLEMLHLQAEAAWDIWTSEKY